MMKKTSMKNNAIGRNFTEHITMILSQTFQQLHLFATISRPDM